MTSPTVPRPRPKRATKTDTTDATDTRSISGNGSGNGEGEREVKRDAPKPRSASSRSLEGRLAEFLGTAALPFALAGDDYCAAIISQRTPALASSLNQLANENPAIRRVLNRLLEGSAWGGVALSVVSIVVPIAQHHGLVPGDDPFGWQYPNTPPRRPMGGIPSPPAGWEGWTAGPQDTSTMGAPAPPDTPQPNGRSNGNEGTDIPVYLDGAPPGVVTVAASRAQHPGAR